MPTSIHFELSETESAVFGLKVARCSTPVLDVNVLRKEILKQEYDVCRIRVSAEDVIAPAKLIELGFPFSFSGSIRRYKTKINSPLEGRYNHMDLQYEAYNGSQDALLKYMINDTLGDNPIGYFRAPFISKIVRKKHEVECLFRYYKKFNNPRNYPENSILFIKHKEDYVGYFALNIVKNNLESHIGGICKKYQQDGYFYDMLRYIKEYCINRNLEHFIFGARNENTIAQKTFERVNFSAHETENVFLISSLLSHSEQHSIKKKMKLANNNAELTRKKILELAETTMKYFFIRATLYDFKQITLRNAKSKNLKVVITVPVKNSSEALVQVKIYDTSEELCVIGYLSALR